MRNALYPRLAAQNLRQNRRFYLPYLLALVGLAAAFYVMAALSMDQGVQELRGTEFVSYMMSLGLVVAAILSAVLVLYINSFLMKQRKKELGLYNILGMGKGNIARLQCWESLYTALVGIVGGILCGFALHWLSTAVLVRLLRFAVPFRPGVSPAAMAMTAALFGGLLLLALLLNLGRVRLSDPIELLRGGQAGEREPRTRWLLAVIGAAALGGGYAIAVLVDDPIMAVALYFLAVLLVIIGTYCLFTAGSIALLKLLRKNKRFYYQTGHFIGVSGMLYRMKRNAVSLANICILSTMVMVMISGTLALYLGTGKIIATQYPTSLRMEVQYAQGEEEPFNSQMAADLAVRFVEERHIPVQDVRTVRYLNFSMCREGDEDGWLLAISSARASNCSAYFLTAADYAALTGLAAPALNSGEIAVCGGQGADAPAPGPLEFRTVEGKTLRFDVAASLPEIAYFSATFDVFEVVCFVVADGAALSDIYRFKQYQDYSCLIFLDLDCTAGEELALEDAWYDAAMDENFFAGTGSWDRWSVVSRAEMEVEGYGMAGGFLFLGILLGGIFLLATALILYYKQVSEGYEDRGRFEIMRKVGLSQREVRASIRSQVLLVFFLPIAAAAVHILFDFNMVVKLLSLLSVRSAGLIAACTGGTLLVFLAVYGLMYLLTARTYYKIVR